MATWFTGQARPETTGLSPGDFVLDGDPAPSPIFGPFLLWPNGWMDEAGTWHGGSPQPGDFVLDGDPAPSPIFGPFLLWPNGCMHQNATW